MVFGKFEVDVNSDLVPDPFPIEHKRLISPVFHRLHGGRGKYTRAFYNFDVAQRSVL